MALFLAPIINSQQEDANGAPLTGGEIEVYLAGTSTPSTTYSDQDGLAPNTWPIVLNTLGVNSQGAVWLTGGAAYKFIIKDSVGVVQRTIDDVIGINDSAVTTDQWIVYQGTPTYVSATSFTLVGDQTQIFQVNRRVKTTNTGGTVYSTITSSAYVAPNTTVTVRNDSGVLDSGLSQVSYGVISVQDSSLTGVLIGTRIIVAPTVYTPTAGTTFILIEAIAPGGGGGATSFTGAGVISVSGGGGGGGYALARFNSGFSGLLATPGTGGAGGVAGANPGQPGGTLTFGAILSVQGGFGGQGSGSGAAPLLVAGGQGGVTATIGGGGTLIITGAGSPGGNGLGISNAGGLGGAGGASGRGTGTGFVGGYNGNGSAAQSAGAGGCGTFTIASTANGWAGGAGGNGRIVIYEFS